MKRHNKLTFMFFFPLLLTLHFVVSAKSSDNDAPVHIEADQMEMREKENISIYTGDVRITRGTIKITGDKIVIQNKDGKLHSINIDGKPATFYQLNDLNEDIAAESRVMNYSADSGTLELKKNALLEKNKNRFSSEHIIYDTLNDIVKAGNTSPPDPQQKIRQGPQQLPRVKVTIHPEKKPGKNK
ncbi:hypothetical protein MNBD_GAMMA09-455 [hydrothermal vent metagenome]|uniref:Organic solvent tolerance-like N-terminal domain-containing protein n=1 Tax=hydrothermal vent metagenome TaxID=652676 RepID=A0A3B0WYC4_9ZZZZ